MRICLDLRAVGPEATGIGAFAGSAAEALLRQGGAHQFLAITNAQAAGALRLPGHWRVAVGGDSWAWGELELPVLLEERGVDVFFSPLFTCPVVRSARQVVTLHDVLPESHPGLCTSEFLAFWKARIGPSLRSACHAVAVSEWSKAQAVEHLKLDPARVSTVHQSVGEQFRPVRPQEAAPVLARHGLAWGGYVLYVGAVDPRKNLERLARAFCQMKGDGLILALTGSEAVKGYGSQVRGACGHSDRVRFLGHVPGEELPALYSGARCFAFPSLAEGFGRPCIEAMACGAPVVASNRTALPETCGDAALLPDAEDEKAVAEALRAACLDDAVRKRLVEAGLKRAAESSPGRFAAELLKAFEAALAGPKEGLWSG